MLEVLALLLISLMAASVTLMKTTSATTRPISRLRSCSITDSAAQRRDDSSYWSDVKMRCPIRLVHAKNQLYPIFRFSEERTGIKLRLESDQSAGTRPTLHIRKYIFSKFHDEQCYTKEGREQFLLVIPNQSSEPALLWNKLYGKVLFLLVIIVIIIRPSNIKNNLEQRGRDV